MLAPSEAGDIGERDRSENHCRQQITGPSLFTDGNRKLTQLDPQYELGEEPQNEYRYRDHHQRRHQHKGIDKNPSAERLQQLLRRDRSRSRTQMP